MYNTLKAPVGELGQLFTKEIHVQLQGLGGGMGNLLMVVPPTVRRPSVCWHWPPEQHLEDESCLTTGSGLEKVRKVTSYILSCLFIFHHLLQFVGFSKSDRNDQWICFHDISLK